MNSALNTPNQQPADSTFTNNLAQPASSPTDVQIVPKTHPHNKAAAVILTILAGVGLVVVGYVGFSKFRIGQTATVIQTSDYTATNSSGSALPLALDSGLATYRDPLGFTFQYPTRALLNQYSNEQEKSTLWVEAIKIEEIEDGPLGWTKEIALKDQQSLISQQYGEEIDFAVDRNVITLGGISAKTFTVLSRYDVCDVTFDRIVITYYEDYRISLKYRGSRSIINSLSKYLTTDNDNCGVEPMWDRDKMALFFQDLVAGTAPQPAQAWYNEFEHILTTFQFTDISSIDGKYVAKEGNYIVISDNGTKI